VEDERNLDGAKGNDQSAHHESLERQIIEDVRTFRNTPTKAARVRSPCCDDNEAGPFQNVAEATHREPEKFALGEAQTFDPSQTNRDQVNLNINAERYSKMNATASIVAENWSASAAGAASPNSRNRQNIGFSRVARRLMSQTVNQLTPKPISALSPPAADHASAGSSRCARVARLSGPMSTLVKRDSVRGARDKARVMMAELYKQGISRAFLSPNHLDNGTSGQIS